MRHYVIDWDGKLAIPTGYGCFYNHSYQPNAIHHKHLDINEIHFHALVDILPFEEITFNYGGFPTCTEPLWFEVKGL
jgi:SET domain-containing protein